MNLIQWSFPFFLLGITSGCFRSGNDEDWFSREVEMRCRNNFKYGRGDKDLFYRGVFCIVYGATGDNRFKRSSPWNSVSNDETLVFPLMVKKEDMDKIVGTTHTRVNLNVMGRGPMVKSITVMTVTAEEPKIPRSKRETGIEFSVEIEDECLDPYCSLQAEVEDSVEPVIRVRRSPQRKKPTIKQKPTPTKATTTTTRKPTTTTTTTRKPTTTTTTTKKPVSTSGATTSTVTPATSVHTTSSPSTTTSTKMPVTKTTVLPTTTTKSPTTNLTSSTITTTKPNKGSNATKVEKNDGEIAIGSGVVPDTSDPDTLPKMLPTTIEGEVDEKRSLEVESQQITQLAKESPELEAAVKTKGKGNMIGNFTDAVTNSSLPQIPNVKIPDVSGELWKLLLTIFGGFTCLVVTIMAYICRVYKCCCQRAPAENQERGSVRFMGGRDL